MNREWQMRRKSGKSRVAERREVPSIKRPEKLPWVGFLGRKTVRWLACRIFNWEGFRDQYIQKHKEEGRIKQREEFGCNTRPTKPSVHPTSCAGGGGALWAVLSQTGTKESVFNLKGQSIIGHGLPLEGSLTLSEAIFFS